MERLGHRFAAPGLLEEALTHPSVLGRKGRDYDRLEFLGDRVVGILVADLIYQGFPGDDAGALARRFNALVRQESLARIAGEIGLGEHLLLNRSEREGGGAGKPAILADAFEAIVAALYLDGGLEVARAFVGRVMSPLLGELATGAKDAKTALQEWAAVKAMPPPVYVVVATDGPPHAPHFTVEVVVGEHRGRGAGPTKRGAEQAAARAVLNEAGQ